MGYKLVEERTKLSSICMVGVQQAIISHHLTWFVIARRASRTSLPGGSQIVGFLGEWA